MWNADLRRKATALLGVSILFVTSLGIFLIARVTMIGPGPAQQAGNVESGSPAEVPEQTLPRKTVQGGIELADKGKIPILQRGVSADQVTTVFELRTLPDVPGFDKTLFKAKRNDVIAVHFKNDSRSELGYQHSFVLVKPGKAGEVILEAQRVGLQQDFIPKTDNVLAASRLINPGETDTIMFRAPDQPGDYPYICTYPGHGNAMRGILRIE